MTDLAIIKKEFIHFLIENSAYPQFWFLFNSYNNSRPIPYKDFFKEISPCAYILNAFEWGYVKWGKYDTNFWCELSQKWGKICYVKSY